MCEYFSTRKAGALKDCVMLNASRDYIYKESVGVKGLQVK